MSAISPAPMPVTLLSWRPITKNALRGFAVIKVGRSLKINDVSVLYSNGKLWVSLPSKPLIADGKALLDERGKQRYVPITECTDKQAAARFSEAVLAAIVAAHGPEAVEPTS
jgi:hypothetical protein